MWTVHELKKWQKLKGVFFFSQLFLTIYLVEGAMSVCQLLLTCLRRFVAISQSYHQKKKRRHRATTRPTFLRVIIWDSHESQNFNGSGFFHASCRNKQLSWICFGFASILELKGLSINYILWPRVLTLFWAIFVSVRIIFFFPLFCFGTVKM